MPHGLSHDISIIETADSLATIFGNKQSGDWSLIIIVESPVILTALAIMISMLQAKPGST